MKKLLSLWTLLLCVVATAWADTVSVTWSQTENNLTSAVSPETAIANGSWSLGDGLSNEGAYSWVISEEETLTVVKLQPTNSEKGNNKKSDAVGYKRYVDFKIDPMGGTFTPASVSFDIIKIGTGDPTMFVDFIDGEGNTIELTTASGGDAIRRNNTDDNTSINHTYNVSAASSSTGVVTLRIYIGKLAQNKQVGVNNIVISGNMISASAPILNASPNSISLKVTPKTPTATGTFTLTGANLTDGTYNVTAPSVDGLSIDPTSFTVADGSVEQTFTLTYAPTDDVAAASTDINFIAGEESTVVTVNYQARINPYEQTLVTEETTWDWSTLGSAEIELTQETTPSLNDEFVFKELEDQINFGSFDAQSIVFSKTQYPLRKKATQNGTVKLKTTQAGLLSVTFSDTGKSGSGYERYLNVQGKNTEYYVMRDGNSDGKKTVSEIYVRPGEVAITGKKDDGVTNAAICIYNITWTPTELQGTDYCIVGDLTGGWPSDTNITDMLMTQSTENENLYTLEIPDFEAEAKTYEYKLRDNYDWDGYKLPANGNYSWNCTEAGVYNLKFVANIGAEQIGDYAPYSVTLVAERPTYDFTVTFINGGRWEHVYAYAWNGDGDTAEQLTGEWPGTEIEKNGEQVNVCGIPFDVYSFTYTGVSAPEKIIFNGGLGEPQTDDLDFADGNQYEYDFNFDYAVAFPDNSELRTLCAPYPLDFMCYGEVEAYIAELSGNRVSFKRIHYAPAGTGVLLRGEPGMTYNCYMIFLNDQILDIDDNEVDVSDNAFIGVLEDTEVPEPGIFVLMNGGEGLGFYETENPFTVGANTAYLPPLAGQNGMIRINLDDVATAIEKAELDRSNAPVYNLQGQRVVQPQKGLYIQGGHKVVLK